MTPEGWAKDDIRKGLERNNISYFMPVQHGFGRRGVDFYVTLAPSGKALLIEAKRPDGKGKLTQVQKNCLAANTAAGGISVVATCWADVESAIQEASEAISNVLIP